MVDPLDGTKEFLSRNGEFTVNVSLVEGHAQILGVVYAPAMDTLYFAAKGMGACKVNWEDVLQIRAARAAKASIRTVVSRSHPSQEENLECIAHGAKKPEFIEVGSSLTVLPRSQGCSQCLSSHWPNHGEWDTPGAHSILEESGGLITGLHGNSRNYNKSSLLNPGFLATGIADEEIQLEVGLSAGDNFL